MSEVFDKMHMLASGKKWDVYWECFSNQGKAWFISAVSTVLAYDAYVQPLYPESGIESRTFIEKYKLEKKELERRDTESIEEQYRRLSRHIDGRIQEFFEDLSGNRRLPKFPKPGPVRILEQIDNRAIVLLPDGMRCQLSKVGDHWYVDGKSRTSR